MNCEEVANRNLTEEYLLGRLAGQDRDEFERHYFSCDRCFEELAIAEEIRSGLRGTIPTRSRFQEANSGLFWSSRKLLPLCAACLLLVIGILWRDGKQGGRLAERPSKLEANVPVLKADDDYVAKLGRFDPPAYKPSLLRGATSESYAFAAAMRSYQRKNYSDTALRLNKLVATKPDSARALFYLGIAQMMTGETPAATESLKRAASLGDTPYEEETHFYLGKAYLRMRDVEAAKHELKMVADGGGAHRLEASRILEELATFGRSE